MIKIENVDAHGVARAIYSARNAILRSIEEYLPQPQKS